MAVWRIALAEERVLAEDDMAKSATEIREETNALVAGVVRESLTAAAIVSGALAAPVVTAVLAASSNALRLAAQSAQRRYNKRLERLEAITERVLPRLAEAEHSVHAVKDNLDEREDLFVSVLRSALVEDEDRKLPIYEGILTWMINERPPTVQVRIVAAALQELAYAELFALAMMANKQGGRDPKLFEYGANEDIVLTRLRAAGLYSTQSTITGDGLTSMGRIICQNVSVADLQPPSR